MSNLTTKTKINDPIQRASKIKCLICDLDGVMTDGSIYMSQSGFDLKVLNALDGVGINMLIKNDIKFAILTTSEISSITHHLERFGVICYTGLSDKLPSYYHLKEELQLDDEAIAYCGDDLPDLCVMSRVGLSIAVANAVVQVKEISHWQTKKEGGHGAVREVCEFILSAQNKLESTIEDYYRRTA
ncbi:hydrolase [Legionella quinlivanii]|uniref:3-deoxy-D-manno-octulosonate 8-phosphate phosphatase KdsC n=1 Tax=Legionella quinlivanii TaxID=45073 RepID=A0A0W0XU50_9GAMM|nr:HAD hydrolase family protein [Legionella quinlivanii]KTD47966.1 hydrolase [Legionella quinlivanii]MCW8450754.1 HAD hydrolase family protein [Legionella quinlivanii]SEG20213.1 3-deoxy-D-manno-octulosonate 8-phosphate phosphatase (KDO 8-P phosphatase) [Legionella quinlivanii DSM 21216]STY11077.1 hydrolase [Legionella quinlivanii]